MTEAIQGLKIGVGTKVDDVYSDKEAFEQARLADKNGDHVIDKDELNRFVGPVFAENVTTKEGRIEGSVMVPTMFGYKRGGLSAVLLKDNEVDYYPEMTFDKIKNGRDMKTFADIDLDGNQKLSKDEIILFGTKNEINRLSNKKKLVENNLKEDSQFKKMFIATLTATVLAGVAVFAIPAGGGVLAALGIISSMACMVGVVATLGFLWGFICCTPKKSDLEKQQADINNQINSLSTEVNKQEDNILNGSKKTK